MTNEEDLERLRRAKRALLAKYGDRPWFRGAGIAPGAGGLTLRLNVDPEVDLAGEEVPESCEGQPVEVVYIGAYEPRPERDSPDRGRSEEE